MRLTYRVFNCLLVELFSLSGLLRTSMPVLYLWSYLKNIRNLYCESNYSYKTNSRWETLKSNYYQKLFLWSDLVHVLIALTIWSKLTQTGPFKLRAQTELITFFFCGITFSVFLWSLIWIIKICSTVDLVPKIVYIVWYRW